LRVPGDTSLGLASQQLALALNDGERLLRSDPSVVGALVVFVAAVFAVALLDQRKPPYPI
jgi:hypothetical protein